MKQLLAALFIFALSACSSGGSSPSVPNISPGSVLPDSGPANASIFVPNDLGTTGSVTAYPANGNGNITPSTTIAGPDTHLGPASALAFDGQGFLYVTNKGVGCVTRCIAVFSPVSFGPDTPPVRTICGSNTGMTGDLEGIAIDSAGNIYVAMLPENILVFAAGASGNVAPVREITGSNTGLASPVGIAVDSSGHIFAANSTGGPTGAGSITEYSATANGNVAPIATIIGGSTGLAAPRGLALGGGDLFVANSLPTSLSITSYTAGANGNVSPLATISGSSTQLFSPNGVALDASGNIYVTNDAASPYITVYAAGSHGNVAPMQTIGGSSTEMSLPGLPAIH